MKLKLIVVLFVILLGITGCSGSNSTPEGKIATINTMMGKGYEMTDSERQKISQSVEEAEKLLSQNKTEEANQLLKKTINTLELIAETDRFNKSE
jgi:hypothetical protein